MTADVELLPCPFCGGRAKTKLPYVRCVDCGGQMCFGDGDAIDAAIAAWNSRTHATAAKDAEIEALRAENKGHGIAIQQLCDRADRLAEALQWYAEQAEGCRKIGSIGEPFRKELDRDGGKRARAALRDHDQEGKDG